MSKNQNRLYFLAPIAVFMICSLVFFLLLRQAALRISPENSNAFLVQLRDENPRGCSSLSGSSLDYFIIGDSHSFSGFDFVTFTKSVNSNKIGVCTLGGFYLETFLNFIQKASATLTNSKVVIYGLSYRQFTDGDNKNQQLKSQENIVLGIDPDFGPNLIALNDRFTDFLRQNKPNREFVLYEESLKKWTPVIETLDEKNVDQFFSSTPNQSSLSWATFLSTAKLNDRFDEMAQQFCDFMTENKIRLVLVDIPESPYLSRLYSEKQIKEYDHVKKKLRSCAALFIDKSAFPELHSNRYFVNRLLTDDWLNYFQTGRLPSTASAANNLYDYDHLNLIGAQILTHKIVALLNSAGEKK